METIAKAINYKPILFSTEMVRAIRNGAKTQTRRLVKDKSTNKPKVKIGDVLWVRETFSESGDRLIWRADVCSKHDLPDGFVWKPSIFMRKELCRYFLEVTGVRCERLVDISPEDSRKEGIPNAAYAVAPVASFRRLWESIHGLESWKDDVFVWVYDFKLIEKPESFN